MAGERREAPLQQELPLRLRGRGGKRENAGRKRLITSGVPHRVRPAHEARNPVHVTLRTVWKVGSLRAKRSFHLIREAIRTAATAREDFRIVHFSVQGNHLHLLVEAEDERCLGRGMQGVAIRIARGINRLLRRKGPVFADRYHRHDLQSRRETRHCIAYVLQNFRKHSMQRGERCPRGWIDECSSAPWFEHWARPPATPLSDQDAPVAKPKSWMLREGWQLYGLIDPDEVPSRIATQRRHRRARARLAAPTTRQRNE